MKIASTIGFSIATMSLTGLVSACITVWSILTTHEMQLYLDVQTSQLSEYQDLSTNVARTFAIVRRDMLSGTNELSFDFDVSVRVIQDNLAAIEEKIHTAALMSENTPSEGELGTISLFRTELTDAVADIKVADKLMSNSQVSEARTLVKDVLSKTVDDVLTKVIDGKIELQKAAIREATHALHRHHHNTIETGVILGVALIALAFLSGWVLIRRVYRGLEELSKGAKEFGNRNFNHRIDLRSGDELEELAYQFNRMAVDVGTFQHELKKYQTDLEKLVEDRTSELAETNEKLEERDENRKNFFADIGHELRTPVTAIRGQAEVALRARENRVSALEGALRSIISLAEQITEDVSTLFFVAREQAGVLDLRVERVNLSKVVPVAVRNLSSLVGKEGGSIGSEIMVNKAMVEGSEKRIHQLLGTLVTNAISHSQIGVSIMIRLKADRNFAYLEVIDDGPGIPLAERNRVFQRYYRSKTENNLKHDNNLTVPPGAGLGLPIAQSIVQAQGGELTIADAEPHGTIVSSRFPLIPRESKQ